MGKITIVRNDVQFQPGILDHAVRILTELADGATAQDRIGWRRLWSWLDRKEPGELATLELVFPRNCRFHRLHFAMESAMFDSQERFADFEQFRIWLKIGAGWVDWAPGPRGGIVPLPKSISYAKADEVEFQEFHRRVMEFLRGEHASRYLWPHLRDHGERAAAILDEFAC